MTPLKIYFTIFSITLLTYNLWSYLHIRKSGTLGKKLKIVVTSSCMLFLGVAAGVVIYDTFNSWYKWFFIALPSIGVWATFTDAFQGTFLHKNPFYLGDSWPDSYVKQIVINGYLYAGFKLIYLLVTCPLLFYI